LAILRKEMVTMIRNLLATTALATLVATAAYAQQQPAPATTDPAPAATTAQPPAPVKAEGYLASNIIGETVYNGTGDNAQNIGDVNDVLLDKTGKTQSVILGVGGFLGIGEHNVAVPFEKLTMVEQNGDRWFVFPSTKEQLEALPEFDRKPYEPAAATTASNTDVSAPATTTTAAPAATDQTASGTANQPAATDTTKTASIDKSTLTKIPPEKLMADKDLVGTTVYGANDENIGEIHDVVLTKDGKADAVIVDVGGFLGIGEKSVAVGFDKLSFMADNGKKYLYTPFTKDQLKAQPAFDEKTFAENRDKQLMRVE